MSEIEITLPTVQYGNVRVRATPEEFGFKLDEPSAFGYALAIYQTSFTLGFKDGSQVDVVAPQGAAQRPLDVGVPGAAEQRVEGDLKPRTVDEADDMAAAVIKRELGATEVNDEAEDARTGSDYTKAPPWDQKVDAPAKPWETGSKPVQSVSELISDEW